MEYDQNTKAKSIKLLEENRKYFHKTGISSFQTGTKVLTTKKQVNQTINIKKICSLKGNINKREDQEAIFVIHRFEKGLEIRICKEVNINNMI